MDVRPAGARDHLGVMRVLDGANLEVDASVVEDRIDAGTVLVADDANRIVGALVAVPREETGAHVEASRSGGAAAPRASAPGWSAPR